MTRMMAAVSSWRDREAIAAWSMHPGRRQGRLAIARPSPHCTLWVAGRPGVSPCAQRSRGLRNSRHHALRPAHPGGRRSSRQHPVPDRIPALAAAQGRDLQQRIRGPGGGDAPPAHQRFLRPRDQRRGHAGDGWHHPAAGAAPAPDQRPGGALYRLRRDESDPLPAGGEPQLPGHARQAARAAPHRAHHRGGRLAPFRHALGRLGAERGPALLRHLARRPPGHQLLYQQGGRHRLRQAQRRARRADPWRGARTQALPQGQPAAGHRPARAPRPFAILGDLPAPQRTVQPAPRPHPAAADRRLLAPHRLPYPAADPAGRTRRAAAQPVSHHLGATAFGRTAGEEYRLPAPAVEHLRPAGGQLPESHHHAHPPQHQRLASSGPDHPPLPGGQGAPPAAGGPASRAVSCAHCRKIFLVLVKQEVYNAVCVHCGGLNRIDPL